MEDPEPGKSGNRHAVVEQNASPRINHWKKKIPRTQRGETVEFLIVGEKINSSRKSVKEAIEKGDTAFIQKLAQEQAAAGAQYIDANAGLLMEKEPEALAWLVKTIQAAVDRPCCLDSPNPIALEAGLRVHQARAMINSISLEANRYDSILALVKRYQTRIIALCIDDQGMPQSADDRFRLASTLIEKLKGEGIPREDIFVDPLVQPISTDSSFGTIALEAMEKIKKAFPDSHLICGLSNISFGLPLRRLLNQVFFILALGRGLDAAIIDPNDPRMISGLKAARALLGQDPFCGGYLKAFRQNLLVV